MLRAKNKSVFERLYNKRKNPSAIRPKSGVKLVPGEARQEATPATPERAASAIKRPCHQDSIPHPNENQERRTPPDIAFKRKYEYTRNAETMMRDYQMN